MRSRADVTGPAGAPDGAVDAQDAFAIQRAALLGWGVGDDLPASDEYGDYPVAVLTEGTDFCVTAPDRAMAGDRILEGDSVFIHRGSGIAYGHICALRLDGKTL